MKKGIDVSYHNGIIDWKRVKNAGIDFAIIRLGYRTTLDTQALYNIREARKQNINVGIYWFLYWDRATIEQNAQACAEYMRSAELALDATWVFTDLEYDSWDKAKERCTRAKCSAYMKQFINALKAQGIKKIGIYCNNDYFQNYINWNEFNGYPVWLADYSGGADYDCVIQQYSSTWHVAGIDGSVDADYLMQDDFFDIVSASDGKNEDTGMTEQQLRQSVVDYLKQYVGVKEGSAGHKAILKVFNDSGLCSRYRMTIYDAWCATAVSSAFISAGLAGKQGSGALFQCVECSCWYMTELAKQQGIWQENDAYRAKVGDVVMYDWQDNGAGDNQGVADHVGIVSSVNGNVMRVIEGNRNDTVSYRDLNVNGLYIRGFITPNYAKYAKKADSSETAEKPVEPVKPYKPTSLTAKSKSRFTVSGNGTPNRTEVRVGKCVADVLNVRTWAGVEFPNIKSYPTLGYGNLVSVCDSIQNSEGSTWYLVKIADKWYGFVSAKYIELQ